MNVFLRISLATNLRSLKEPFSQLNWIFNGYSLTYVNQFLFIQHFLAIIEISSDPFYLKTAKV